MNRMMKQLTEHFSLREFTQSQTAGRCGIGNNPNGVTMERMVALCEKVLEPLRKIYDAPIRIGSGYRCPSLNKAVGGAKNSQHIRGEAADITSLYDDPELNMLLAKMLVNSQIPFDQCIIEHPDAKGNPNWIHVSYTTERPNRRQLLTCIKGHYFNGWLTKNFEVVIPRAVPMK